METSEEQRRAFIRMHNNNVSARDIASIFGVNKSTVTKWIQRHRETQMLKDKPRLGQPPCTTPDEDNKIVEAARQQPIITAVAIKHQIGCDAGGQVIRKTLHASGIHHRAPAIKPGLSQAHKDERLGFALEYYAADAEFWSKVIFCDEKTFSTDTHGRAQCWRLNNTR
ncbi:uncharacterized protein [Macrobrachium rosenbergii]|uniref:uncharacterized protein n=1 Tax=Macrobrachium rosenbergii TaxID=79674 RepID=UPI0034D786C3